MNIVNNIIRAVCWPRTLPLAVGQSLAQSTSHIKPIVNVTSLLLNRFAALSVQERGMASLAQMHRSGPHVKPRNPKRVLDGRPFMKGVVLKTLIKKPKKPNSANRKCVLVRLSNGKEMVAYIPGTVSIKPEPMDKNKEYEEKRSKNNEAAKKSRENRKNREDEKAHSVARNLKILNHPLTPIT
ncbi:hypothetical protein HUJ05_000356 [Dendroctonus ponderosae]|nr:hypothetical protein HUJ05_000356 [Dendroctonus ponderosae]